MLTCIHVAAGLCSRCKAAFVDDPVAYVAYGDHPEGLRRWEALRDEIWSGKPPCYPEACSLDDLPF